MVDNLRPIQLPDHLATKKLLVYVASLPLQEDSTIWKFEMTRTQWAQRWLPGELMLSAWNSFRYSRGKLAHRFHSEHPQNVVLTQLISTPNRHVDASAYPTHILRLIFDPIGQTAQYFRRDDTKFFVAGTRQL